MFKCNLGGLGLSLWSPACPTRENVLGLFGSKIMTQKLLRPGIDIGAANTVGVAFKTEKVPALWSLSSNRGQIQWEAAE